MGIKDKKMIDDEFDRIHIKIGRVPTRVELLDEMDPKIYKLSHSETKLNIFKNYMKYLKLRCLLSFEEEKIYSDPGFEIISYIEKTPMTKVYKMIVLKALYNNGNVREKISMQEILSTWIDFFNEGDNYKEFLGKEVKTRADYKQKTHEEHMDKIKNMPCKYLLNSGKDIFIKLNGYPIAINSKFHEIIKNETFKRHMGDAINYRILDYYK